jgi:uncharacterized protein (DUF302 family)
MKYGISRTTSLPFDEALEGVTLALQKEGFGVLTTIDVKETLKKKLDIDFKRYVILGACNPSFAHQALLAEEEIGLLLPCNIIVYERDGATVVAAFNPMTMTALVDNRRLETIASEVRVRLERAIESV